MYKKPINIKDIQTAAFKILQEFVKICDENGLNYYISGGTFLGAVRHKGFIPWDDDVDVAMPRRDYLKFINIASNELPSEYKLIHFESSPNTIHYFAKIEDCNFKLIDHTATIPRKVNVWIDIFPLDGLPTNVVFRKFHCFRLLSLRAILKFSLFDVIVNLKNMDRPWYEKLLIQIGKKVKFNNVLDSYECMSAIDRALSKYDFYEQKYVMNFMGAYKLKSIMDRERVYGEGAYYTFEGVSLHAPKDYDYYLKQIYGDYTKLPSVVERNKHQTTIVFDE